MKTYKWTKEKPTKRCIFIARTKECKDRKRLLWEESDSYMVYKIVLNNSGEKMAKELCDYTEQPLEELQADEYMIIEEL